MDHTVDGILQVRIQEWVAFPFSRGSSQPRTKPRSPALHVDSLPAEPQGKPSSLNCSAKTAEKAQYPPILSLISYPVSTVYKALGLSKGHGGRRCCTLESCVQLEGDLSSGACLSFDPLRIYLAPEGDCITDQILIVLKVSENGNPRQRRDGHYSNQNLTVSSETFSGLLPTKNSPGWF